MSRFNIAPFCYTVYNIFLCHKSVADFFFLYLLTFIILLQKLNSYSLKPCQKLGNHPVIFFFQVSNEVLIEQLFGAGGGGGYSPIWAIRGRAAG